MESQESVLSRDASGLRIWSCVTCRRRKVRCDRVDPACNNCLRSGIDCHYPLTGRLPRRRGPESSSRPPRTGAQKQAELISRLRKLEAVVTEMSTQVEQGVREQGLGEDYAFRFHPRPSASVSASTPSVPESQTDGSWSSQANDTAPSSGNDGEEDFGPIVLAKDGALQIGNRFWTVFCNEADSVFRMVEEVTNDNETNDDEWRGEGSGGSNPNTPSFGLTPGSPPLDGLHISTSQLTMMWETFARRVDAFIKILHFPTMEGIYQSLRNNPISTLSLEINALVSAISLAAIVSMDEDDIMTHFNSPKSEVISHIRKSTEQALTNADYLTTRNTVTLQAFTIYVAMLPYLGAAKLAYTLVGSLTRLAVSVGLHKDGSRNSNWSFMAVEMRRRLWWQICFLDSSSRDPNLPAEVFINKDMFDTRMPSIIDDQDLALATKDFRYNEIRSRQMTLCWVRCQIWGAMRLIRTSELLQACLNQLDKCRSYIDKECLQKLRPEVPFDSYIRTMVSLAYSKIEVSLLTNGLREHQAAGGADQMAADILHSQLFTAALNVVEAAYALKSRSDWKDWRWHLQGHVPWNAIGIALHHIKRQPWSSSSERAWVATNGLFDMLGEKGKAEAPWEGIAALVATTGSYRERSSSYGLPGSSHSHGVQNMAEGNLSDIIAQTSLSMLEVSNDDSPGLNFDPTFTESGDWQYWADLIDMDLTI